MANTTSVASPPLLEGRISATTFRVVVLVTFSLALLAATCRFFALVRQRKRVGLDDIFMILAAIFLVAGTTILLIQIEAMYYVEGIDLNGLPVGSDTKDVTGRIDRFQKLRWSFLAISWASIYFVKFSFLAFFSGLCDRMPKIDLYRKTLYGLCVITFIYLVLNGIVTCPQDGADIIRCTSVNALQQNMAMGITAIALDILTDLTILSIPIILLWRVKLRTYQKMVIGIALCLSVVMVMLAITRIIGFRYRGVIDNSWIYLWQHVEASAAVTMISLTAFRSVFTLRKHKSWNTPTPNFLRNAKVTSSPAPPDATRTGISTTIGCGITKDVKDNSAQPGIAITVDYIIQEEEVIQLPERALP